MENEQKKDMEKASEENIQKETRVENVPGSESIEKETASTGEPAKNESVNSPEKKKQDKKEDSPKASEKKEEPSKKDEKKENPDNNEEKEERKETIDESEMIDINKPEENAPANDTKKATPLKNKAPKTTEDFIAKQKKRKRTKRIVVIVIIALLVVAGIYFFLTSQQKKKDAMAALQANSVQTSFVEKKTLYDSKDATGTLYALESRTISRSLQGSGNGGAKIEEINVSVGDHVSTGDVLVQFSSENIEKSIAEAKEDIGTQKKLDAINAEDAQRSYVNSYSNAANSLQSAAENVDRKLEALYEACDAYGKAKQERDDIKNMSDGAFKDKYGASSRETILQQYENAVTSAYNAQKNAQREYDAAVEAQATSGQSSASSVANSLSQADSDYKKAQINSGESVKKLQRQLNDSIDSLDDYVVYATIDGVVTEVNVSEGNTFVSGNVLTIQDDSGYKADVLIDEYDIPKVKKAYEAKKANGEELEVVVKTDATGDNEYKGHVTLIAPTSTSTTSITTTVSSNSNGVTSTTSSSSTANYKVSIELDEIDESFMIGMSAKVAIIVDESPENSLCVPYNCVEETEDGRYIVKVMDEHGDKSTSDSNRPSMGDFPSGMPGKPGSDSEKTADSGSGETKGVNGIVIENDTDDSGKSNPDMSNEPGKKGNFLSSLFNKNDAPVDTGRRYREVEVEKIFDTDYYAAVVPKVEGSLNDGDEVMVVTEKASGNDIMAMFGGMGGGPR